MVGELGITLRHDFEHETCHMLLSHIVKGPSPSVLLVKRFSANIFAALIRFELQHLSGHLQFLAQSSPTT